MVGWPARLGPVWRWVARALGGLLLVGALALPGPALAADPTPVATPGPDPDLSRDAPDEVLVPASWVVENLEGGVTNMVYRTAKAAYVNLLYAPGEGGDWEHPTAYKPWSPGGAFPVVRAADAWSRTLSREARPRDGQAFGPADLVFYTPSFLSYLAKPVVDWQQVLGQVATLIWVVFVALFVLKVYLLIQAGSKRALAEITPQVVRYAVAYLLIALAVPLVGTFVEIGNDLSTYFGGHASEQLFSVYNYQVAEAAANAYQRYPEYVVALAFYVGSLYLLTGLMFARLLFLDMLFIFAPLAFLLLTMAETRRYGMLWATTVVALIFSQPLTVAFLQLASSSVVLSDSTPVLKLLLTGATLLGTTAVPPLFQGIVFQHREDLASLGDPARTSAQLQSLRQRALGRRP